MTIGLAPLEGDDLAAFDTAMRRADAELHRAKARRQRPMRHLRSHAAA